MTNQTELTAERVDEAIHYLAPIYDSAQLDGYKRNLGTALAALRAEQERQWISVEDRLPEHPPDTIDEKGRLCFCTTNYVLVTNGKIVYPAYFEHQGKQPGYFWYRYSLNEIADITHWMPLPKPPKEDEHA